MFIRSLQKISAFAIILGLFCLMGFNGKAQAQQRRALIIGDSHVVGPMGRSLQQLLQQRGFLVERNGQSGRNPSNFVELDSLIAGHRNSEFVIAEFGDNMAGYRGGTFRPQRVQAEMNRLLSAFRQAGRLSPERCVIVSPTYGERGPIHGIDYVKTDARLAELISTMREAVGNNCTFIDSRTLPEMESGAVRTTDSLHLTRQWGALWASGILGRIDTVAPEAPRPVAPSVQSLPQDEAENRGSPAQ